MLSTYPGFSFIKQAPPIVLHLGAQEGYAISSAIRMRTCNPTSWCFCRNFAAEHLACASSSSVYGMNEKVPFSISDTVDFPYAATKKSNELVAHYYTHLYGFPSTGLRFCTVYVP